MAGGGLFPEFNLISNSIVNHLNCLARLGSKSSTGSRGCCGSDHALNRYIAQSVPIAYTGPPW
eukprot:10585633-Prorocentrum_lima.AAC.1